MIKHLKYHQIDKQKWDECIQSCSYGFIYAQCWFLDIVSPGWSALVDADYKAVMPLPNRQKWGMHYVVQPYFAQQLGVFSIQRLDQELFNQFIKRLKENYRYVALNFNFSNLDFLDPSKEIRQTQVLSLNTAYDLLQGSFSDSNKKNIRRALRQNIIIKDTTTVDEMTLILGKDKPHLWSKKSLELAVSIMRVALQNKSGKLYGAYADNILVSACFILFDPQRVYLLFSSSSEIGVSSKSKFLITAEIIKNYSNSNLFLEFMGSMIPGVNFFNSGFGAVELNYAQVKINRLPFPLNLLKR